MNKRLPQALLVACFTLWLSSVSGQTFPESVNPNVTSAIQVTERGANHRVWSTVTWRTNLHGVVRAQTNALYTELTTGMHFQSNGTWAASDDTIHVTATGGASMKGQHQVDLLGNLNTQGAVDIAISETNHLRGHILGLSYYDTASGDSVMIADIKDCLGEILPSGNRALYRDAFDGVSADVLYVNSLNGFEQLVVLREQPPSPSAYGLNPQTTVLEVITEFINPPNPVVTDRTPADGPDQDLSFGKMRMLRGKAFALGSETNKVAVKKQWLLMEGRHCLVEQVPLPAAEPALRRLPQSNGGSSSLRPVGTNVLHRLAGRRPLPPAPQAKVSSSAFQIAKAEPEAPGFVVDYDLSGAQTNLTLRGDTTYYVSGPVSVVGDLTVEGGTVVKFSTSTDASIAAINVICKTAAYRPAVFTGKDDNSVGATISGSSGDPTTNYYGGFALDLHDPEQLDLPAGGGLVLSNFHFRYLNNALFGYGLALRNAQFESCNAGLFVPADFMYGYSHSAFYNVLVHNVNTFIGTDNKSGDEVIFVNVTAHNCPTLFFDNTSMVFYTNCLFAAVSNWNCWETYADHSVFLSSDAGVFQTVGAGAHYLADNSPYRDAGLNQDEMDQALLGDLRGKTTYPPIALIGQTSTVDVALSRVIQRDTDVLDLGYHYDPLDYVTMMFAVTNASVTINPGTAIGFYNHAGIWLQGSAPIICEGAPILPNRIVGYQSVQELGLYIGTGSISPILNNRINGAAASGRFRFTEFDRLAYPLYGGTSSYNLYATSPNFSFTELDVSDCQMFGGNIYYWQNSGALRMTNNLLAVPAFYVTGPSSLIAQNNLFFRALVDLDILTGGDCLMTDNAFDSGDFSDGFGDILTDHRHNAYINNPVHLVATNSTDIVLTGPFSYATGPLGRFYQSASTLRNQGSTTANLVGLYHYTTQSNQVKEANSVVDIGFHYVAVDIGGAAIDSDGDGIPDYLEDRNGNGSFDSGESDWLTYNSGNGLATGSGLQVFTPLK